MKIKVDEQDLFELSDVQKKVICNDIHEDMFDEDMKRRLQYILTHKYERCLEVLKQEWMPKLRGRVPSVPTDDDAFAQLVFSQKDYKNRSQRDAESRSPI